MCYLFCLYKYVLEITKYIIGAWIINIAVAPFNPSPYNDSDACRCAGGFIADNV